LIIFYEKIRTNGRGTIRIDKFLCDNLFELSEDFLIVQLNYFPKKDELFSLTTSGISVLWASLAVLLQGISLKIRGTRQSNFNLMLDSADTHSSNELKEAVYSMSTGPLVILLKFSWKRAQRATLSSMISSKKPKRKATNFNDK
jgi:hypothetical protein